MNIEFQIIQQYLCLHGWFSFFRNLLYVHLIYTWIYPAHRAIFAYNLTPFGFVLGHEHMAVLVEELTLVEWVCRDRIS